MTASIIARASPSTGRLRPAPNSASMISAGFPIACGLNGEHRVLPAARGGGRVALELVALAHQDHRDLAPLGGELGGCDKTVAAIVAGAGHDQDRPLLHQRVGGLGDRLARAQHQLEAGRAGRDRELVGALHFGVGQNFHATSLYKRLFNRHLRCRSDRRNADLPTD
ncbi:hypothetical protein ABIE83_004857 [Bradyrhizobium diazoefficiens]